MTEVLCDISAMIMPCRVATPATLGNSCRNRAAGTTRTTRTTFLNDLYRVPHRTTRYWCALVRTGALVARNREVARLVAPAPHRQLAPPLSILLGGAHVGQARVQQRQYLASGQSAAGRFLLAALDRLDRDRGAEILSRHLFEPPGDAQHAPHRSARRGQQALCARHVL